MLEMRPTCENCNKSLDFDSDDAMICTFECAYCSECANLFQNMCPNCLGEFQKRPKRPRKLLSKHPTSNLVVFKPVDLKKHLAKVKREL